MTNHKLTTYKLHYWQQNCHTDYKFGLQKNYCQNMIDVMTCALKWHLNLAVERLFVRKQLDHWQ